MSFLELHIDSPKLQSSNLLVRWCLTPSGVEALLNKPQANAHVLLVVAAPTGEFTHLEKRDIVPFTDGRAYIPALRSGENYLYAVLIELPKNNTKETKRIHSLFYGRDNEHTVTFLESDGKSVYEYATQAYCYGIPATRTDQTSIATLVVDVPKEVFAPEPKAWEKRWVNWAWRHKPEDQCAFRKRRLFAYSLQPLLFLAFGLMIALISSGILVARLLTVIFLFIAFGVYGYDWKELVDPLTFVRDVAFLPTKEGFKSPFFREPLLQFTKRSIFAPLILCLAVLGAFGIGLGIRKLIEISSWWYFGVLGGIPIGILILIFLGRRISGKEPTRIELVVGRSFHFIAKCFRRLLPHSTKVKSQKLLTEESIQVYACPQAAIPVADREGKPRTAYNPKRPKTVRLVYQDLKAKVCKPYAH